MKSKIIAALVALAVLVVVIAIIGIVGINRGSEESSVSDPTPAESPSSEPTATTSPTEQWTPSTDPHDPDLKAALSKPVEDSVYPNVGDPGVDALHYGLDLEWDPESTTLTGSAEIVFRATAAQQQFQLDLGKPLDVETAILDGEEIEFEHTGKDLVLKAPVAANQRYVLELDYSGRPEPTPAPTTRTDFDAIGFTITEDGDVWTMQEPYGAFTWFPVNDQPADKALYDFTITAPSPMVGVANGELVDRTEEDDKTITEWHLDSPAASYLTTLAIADYEMTEDESDSGVPLTYWTPTGDESAKESLAFTREAMAWLEKRLGAYPFSSLGSVVVDSESAMETQTMITYGDTAYAQSPETVIHELAHHWYGDTVTPDDWRDVWMNEGMAMYLQGVFTAAQSQLTVDEVMDTYVPKERPSRRTAGPPGDYDPRTFGENNIYYGPALMWHELRKKIDDDRFWAMLKKWPTVHKDGNATREQYLAWIEQETGEELTAFFDAWLLGKKAPGHP